MTESNTAQNFNDAPAEPAEKSEEYRRLESAGIELEFALYRYFSRDDWVVEEDPDNHVVTLCEATELEIGYEQGETGVPVSWNPVCEVSLSIESNGLSARVTKLVDDLDEKVLGLVSSAISDVLQKKDMV